MGKRLLFGSAKNGKSKSNKKQEPGPEDSDGSSKGSSGKSRGFFSKVKGKKDSSSKQDKKLERRDSKKRSSRHDSKAKAKAHDQNSLKRIKKKNIVKDMLRRNDSMIIRKFLRRERGFRRSSSTENRATFSVSCLFRLRVNFLLHIKL